jgi:hypothetical protein
MKNRAKAEALPKFSRGASAGSREEDEPLDDAGMAKLERHMAVHGTTATRFARRARNEEAAPEGKGNGAYYRACNKAITKAPDPLGVALSPEAAGRISLAMVNGNGHFSVLHNLARFEEPVGMRSWAGGHLVAFEGEVQDDYGLPHLLQFDQADGELFALDLFPPQTSGLRHCFTSREARTTTVSSTRLPPPRPEASGKATSYPYLPNGGPTSWITRTLGPHCDG